MLNTLEKPHNRLLWISEASYFLAEARGFVPDKALEDWLEAEISYSEMLIAAYLAGLEEDNESVSTFGLQQLAASIGVENPDKLISKAKLVQAIQNYIKHRSCFRREDINSCQELECQWKSECRKLTAAWHSD